LRQLDKEALITCFSEEKEFPYNKCFLADYLHGAKEATDILIRTPEFLETQNINLVLGVKILTINPEKKTITDHNNVEHKYEKLLIATGGSVGLLPIKGIGQAHVLTFYTLHNTHTLLATIKNLNIKNIVIIGAGLSGLECADAVSKYVEKVSVVESQDHLLPRQVTAEGAQIIAHALKQQNIDFYNNVFVQEILTDDVVLSNTARIKADLVVVACGAKPNGWIASDAGLETKNGAIVTNNYLQTSDPSIFAAGDVALVTETLTQEKVKSCTWPDALIQGAVAASNMAGIERLYSGVTIVTSSAFFGVKFFSAGIVHDRENKYQKNREISDQSYRLIVHDNGVVKGFLLIGQTHGVSELKQALLTGKAINLH
ncbi:NAD(P)/FAD-dependent oxidoreductase, partial [bacterium]|nr:NAD(P)/FAD-dependent oxidoreductase [bacterium]